MKKLRNYRDLIRQEKLKSGNIRCVSLTGTAHLHKEVIERLEKVIKENTNLIKNYKGEVQILCDQLDILSDTSNERKVIDKKIDEMEKEIRELERSVKDHEAQIEIITRMGRGLPNINR